MNIRYTFLLFMLTLSLTVPHHAMCQSFLKSKPIDTSFINPNPSEWSFRLYTVTKQLHFSVLNTASEERVLFIPDPKLSVGIGGSWNELLLDLGVAFNTTSKNDSIEKTKNLDLLGSVYIKRFLLDVSFQIYRGYNVDTVNKMPFMSYRNDVRTFNLGFNYSYLFNYRKLSIASSFLGNQIQKKSAGSLMAGAFLTYFDLRSEESVIPLELANMFNEEANFTEANLISGGLSAGYVYTFVLPKSFFITLSANPGICLNVGDLKTVNYYTLGYPPTVTFKFFTRNAIGYNGRKYYSYFSYHADYNFVSLRHDNRLDYDLLKAKLVLGRRLGI